MKKILLIINPVAGKLRSRTALFDIVRVFCTAGYTVTTQITLKRGHAASLASHAKDEGYDLVVCCGGDGTLNEVITGMMGSGTNLPLGYIPAGSTNDFATTLDLSPIPSRAAAAITREKPITLDIGHFNDKQYFTYIASFGAFTATSYTASQEAKNMFGHLAYLVEGLKDITSIRAHKVKVVADGKEYSGNYIFGSVSNTKSVAGIVKLRTDIEDLMDGLFEVILVKNPRNPLDLNKIVTGITMSDFSGDMFEFFKARSVQFSMGKSIPWSLDGEHADGGSTVNIHNIPNAITILK